MLLLMLLLLLLFHQCGSHLRPHNTMVELHLLQKKKQKNDRITFWLKKSNRRTVIG